MPLSARGTRDRAAVRADELGTCGWQVAVFWCQIWLVRLT